MPTATATGKTRKKQSRVGKAVAVDSRSKRTSALRTPKSPSGRKTAARGQAAALKPVTPDDLLQFKLVGSPRVSPDGATIVFVRKHVGDKPKTQVSNLWIVPTNQKSESLQFTNGEKDSHPRWSPDGSRLAFVSGKSEPGQQVFLINADGGESTVLTRLPEGTIRDLRWSPDGTMLAIAFRETASEWTKAAKEAREKNGLSDPPLVLDDWWYRLDGDGYFGAQRFGLYIVSVETGEHRQLYTKDRLGFFDFDFAPDSKRIVITSNRDPKAMIRHHKAQLEIIDIATGTANPIEGPPPGTKSTVRWSPDGRLIAYAGREGTDSDYSVENLELWVCDVATGKARSLTSDTDYCLLAAALTDTAEVAFAASFQWSADSKTIFMKLGWHGESHVAAVPARGGAIRFLTSGVFDYDMGNLSASGGAMALLRSSQTELPEVYVGAVKRHQIEPVALTSLNTELLAARSLSRPTEHWIESTNGNSVHTWVMLPPDFKAGSKKKYPAILEIHGGPHAQYGVGFFHEFQVLASAGYVVVFCNPRGSKGYGRDYCAAIRGHWGTADWEDIQSVTRFMQQHPNVDNARMGVMGGSYGGYMTNWVIGHCRDFAGAITDRCVSNLISMAGNSDFIEAPDDYFPGNFWDKPEQRWEQSPIRYLGNARTPTLIIHSEGDLRCNIEQAEQVFAALKLNNVPTRFIRYPRSTSHGLSRSGPPDLRMHRLQQILAWWKRWLNKSRK